MKNSDLLGLQEILTHLFPFFVQFLPLMEAIVAGRALVIVKGKCFYVPGRYVGPTLLQCFVLGIRKSEVSEKFPELLQSSTW